LGCPSFTFTAVSFNANSDTSLEELVVYYDESFIIDGDAYTETGSYEVILESSDIGCDSIISFSILNITPIAIINGQSEVSCTNDLVELGSSNSVMNYNATNTLLWEKEGLFCDDTESISAVPCSYTLTVISTIAGVVCAHATDFEIFVIPTFIPIINGELDTLCYEEWTMISIQPLNGTYPYLWQNESNTLDIIVCPEVTTIYSVPDTDIRGCQQITYTTVSENPLSDLDILDTQMCIVDTLDVSASREYIITLSNPALTVIYDNVLGLNSGVIDTPLYDQDGCTQPNTDFFVTIILQVFPNPILGVLDIKSNKSFHVFLFNTPGVHFLSKKYQNQKGSNSLRESLK
jgi:hypothetical protein